MTRTSKFAASKRIIVRNNAVNNKNKYWLTANHLNQSIDRDFSKTEEFIEDCVYEGSYLAYGTRAYRHGAQAAIKKKKGIEMDIISPQKIAPKNLKRPPTK